MSGGHHIYAILTPCAVAALVEGSGWHAAYERWGDRLSQGALQILERKGRRPGRVIGMQIPRGPADRFHCHVDARWDDVADRLSHSAAAALTGVPRRAIEETLH